MTITTHTDLITEREYGTREWQRFNKKTWDQVYTFVPKPMIFESYLYNYASELTNGQYTGGQWEVIEINGGGFYFRPIADKDDKWKATSTAYQCDMEMSSDGFGLALSIMVFANYQMYINKPIDYLTELYHKCRDLAFNDIAAHPENDYIFRLID